MHFSQSGMSLKLINLSAMNMDDFVDEYKKVESGEIRPFEFMRKLGMSKTTYYRFVKRLR